MISSVHNQQLWNGVEDVLTNNTILPISRHLLFSKNFEICNSWVNKSLNQ